MQGMRASGSSGRDQVLYEKSVYLRMHSGTLLDKAQELCRTSGKLRKTNAYLASDRRVIRSSLIKFASDHGFQLFYNGFKEN